MHVCVHACISVSVFEEREHQFEKEMGEGGGSWGDWKEDMRWREKKEVRKCCNYILI